jgi:3D (Asp-Asp-Asp) domain-containing protein
LKLVGIKEFYNITREKIISALNAAVIVTVCAAATFIVDASLDSTAVLAKPIETFPESSETEPVVVTDETSETTDTSESTDETNATTITVTVTVVSTPAPSESSSETSQTSETTAATTETTAATTASTTAETKEKVTEKELYLAVYATTTINVRSGPGTDYDVVKSLHAGDKIDVIAVTSNGWYKTYNGNYVKKDYTTESKPTNTPTPKPKQTSATAAETERETEAQHDEPSGDGNTCTITFYGPQPNGDGTYNKSTATGSTCTEGRTCAADWSIYPAGTVIYIENDPLGGDGYYTVEDRGPGVKGYHIDIYADDGESGNYYTCKRTVYVA